MRPSASREGARQSRALATVCAVLFLTFLDNTIVSVALADIQNGLHPGVTALQWIIDGYALVFAALMLTGGALGDQLGRKKVMLSGAAVFCVGSIVAATAPNTGALIAGRVVMGAGAAASEPGTLSMLRHIYPDARERARALGVWAAIAGLALALGPVIGGVIVGWSGWRGVFWFNLAFGVAAFWAALVTLEETSDPQGRRVDLPGLTLGALVLAAGTYAVIGGETSGYATWFIVALFAVAVAGGAGFVVVESRADKPVLDLAFFRVPTFTGANAVAFTTYFGVFAIFFFVALYLQLIVNDSAFTVALDFGPMAVAMIAASALTGRWVARVGPRVPMVIGCLLGGAGILATDGLLNPSVGFASLGWSLALAGVGFGIAIVPVTSSTLAVVPAERSGMAASTTNTSRELGAVFGVAVLGAIVNAQLTAHLTARLRALGIPAQFQALVLQAVTHGGVPKGAGGVSNPQAKGNASIVNQVIHAAEQAFYSGLDIALLVSGALLCASAVLAWATIGRQERGALSYGPRGAVWPFAGGVRAELPPE